MLRLVAEVQELEAILSELERQQKESEKPRKEMIDEWEEMKLQLQHVLNKKDSKYHIRRRSDLEKHLTIKNCDRTFLKNIIRFKKLKS